MEGHAQNTERLTMILRDYQQTAIDKINDAYNRGVRSMLLAMATGAGKCLGEGTPVLMFDGAIKPVEQVAAGELLMGPDSTPRRVLSTTEGVGPLYRVTPIKGDSYVVNDAHVLSLVISGKKTVCGHAPGSTVNISVIDYLAQEKYFKHCAKGWRTGVEFQPHGFSAKLEPYFLGLWLGDGTSRNSSLTTGDPEIIEYLYGYAGRLGMDIRVEENSANSRVYHPVEKIRRRGPGNNRICVALRSYNLILNKHIPHRYLTGNRDERLDVLAGLLDTDGHYSGRGFDLILKSERLIDDTVYLARSLGFACYKSRRHKTCTNNGAEGDYWSISISGNLDQIPTKIARKKASPRAQKKNHLVTGITVEPIGTGKYFGFEIDGDHLFLLGDFTVTHNTVVFADLVSRRPGRALILAHRDRLIQQAAEKLEAIIPRHKIGIVKAEMNQCAADVVVASVQTLARPRRLAKMPTFDTVIVDECHRSAAVTYRRILDHVRHQDTLLLGVTATPSRADGIGLDEIYEEIVHEVGILQLIEEGHLAPLRGQKIYIAADFSSLHTRTNTDGINDYRQDEVVKLMAQADWYKHVTEGWLKCAADRRTLAFVPPGKDDDDRSTAMAFQLADYMRERGVTATAVNGQSDLGEQRRVIRDFEAGQLQVIVNCDLYTEGVDIPSINCIVFARPTKSQIVYAQAIGRGTRPSPETSKTDCLVLDVVGASNRFDLCTLGSLFGIKSLKDDEDVSQAIEREKKEHAEQAEREQETLRVKGEVRAKDIDLFGGRSHQQPQQEKKKLFDWIIYRERKQSFLVSGGHEFMISKIGDTYTYADLSWSGKFQGQTRNYNEAKDACEAELRRKLFGGRDAPWRGAPASEKQIALLTKFKIPIKPDITKGEASDLLDAKFSKKKSKEVVRI